MNRRSQLAIFAVSVAASTLVPNARALVLRQGGTFPTQIVGTWTRKVTSSDIGRAHVPQSESGEVFPGAVYTLTIQKSGTASLRLGRGQNGGHWSGPIVPAAAHRVHILLPFAFANTYSWRVTGRQLTFTKINDSDRTVHFREAVFGGLWKRK